MKKVWVSPYWEEYQDFHVTPKKLIEQDVEVIVISPEELKEKLKEAFFAKPWDKNFDAWIAQQEDLK